MSECKECGMIVSDGDYHPYAACLMFKGYSDGAVVEANLDAVLAYGAQTKFEALTVSLEAMQKRESMLVDYLHRVCDDKCNAEYNPCEARQLIDATSAETEAWLQAEILKRLGEPVAEKSANGIEWQFADTVHDMPIGTKLYALSIAAEERKDE